MTRWYNILDSETAARYTANTVVVCSNLVSRVQFRQWNWPIFDNFWIWHQRFGECVRFPAGKWPRTTPKGPHSARFCFWRFCLLSQHSISSSEPCWYLVSDEWVYLPGFGKMSGLHKWRHTSKVAAGKNPTVSCGLCTLVYLNWWIGWRKTRDATIPERQCQIWLFKQISGLYLMRWQQQKLTKWSPCHSISRRQQFLEQR